jgi:thiamine biosynthesis lipoprotein
VSASFSALGTTVTLAVVDPGALDAANAVLRHELALIDRTCSRFRADSELTCVNRAAGRQIGVSALLYDALRTGLAAARATDGIVDPTVGRALEVAGYDATFSLVRARDGQRFAARFATVPGWRTVELDDARHTVRAPQGVVLDLGATGKALAADRAARAAALGIGGDIAVHGTPPAGGWALGIGDDHGKAPDPGSTVAILAGGLATSSATVRRWRSGSRELHHLIDPRTGRPADTPWRTVSVAASTCVDANTASAAAMILGVDAPAWLAERRLPTRLVGRDGAILCLAGWPADAA